MKRVIQIGAFWAAASGAGALVAYVAVAGTVDRFSRKIHKGSKRHGR